MPGTYKPKLLKPGKGAVTEEREKNRRSAQMTFKKVV